VIELPEQRIDRIIASVIAAEGGDAYTNNPGDPGGPTRFGITERTARAAGYTGAMASLPREVAEAIYRKRYVTDPGYDRIVAIDPSIGAELVDTGVNCGVGVASTLLQRWLNGFNVAGARYAPLKVDGSVGPATIEALKAYLRWRGPMGTTALLKGLNGSQAEYYLTRTENNPGLRQFLQGWVLNRVEI
jgi:Putative secretion activating protein